MSQGLRLVFAGLPDDPRNPYPPRIPRREPDPAEPPAWFRKIWQMAISVGGAVFGFYIFYIETTRYGGRPYVLAGAIGFVLGPSALLGYVSGFMRRK